MGYVKQLFLEQQENADQPHPGSQRRENYPKARKPRKKRK